MQAFDKIMRLVTNVAGALANIPASSILTTVGGFTLTGGFIWTPFDFGSVSSGNITPDPLNGLKQTVTNNGNFEIDPPTDVGDIELHVTNGSTPGTITFGSGWNMNFIGDPLDTTVGHKFVIYIYGWGTLGADRLIKARQ